MPVLGTTVVGATTSTCSETDAILRLSAAEVASPGRTTTGSFSASKPSSAAASEYAPAATGAKAKAPSAPEVVLDTSPLSFSSVTSTPPRGIVTVLRRDDAADGACGHDVLGCDYRTRTEEKENTNEKTGEPLPRAYGLHEKLCILSRASIRFAHI